MPSTFLGRAADADRLRRLVADAALVTVTGPGGVGKTRLVRETLRSDADGPTGGPVVCELAPLRAGADAAAVNAEVGFASPEAAAASLRSSNAVLVLDNCEHVLDGVALFVSRLLQGGDGVRVVATSREPLGVQDEELLVVTPLGLPQGGVDLEDSPAVRLFLDRARAAGAGWEATPEALSAIGELCRRLDGLPLAIELASARTRALTPVELLDLMSHRLDLLEANGRERVGGLERHRSLRAALDVSIELLAEDERVGFESLGVFGGPFDLDQAHAVVAPEGGDRLATADLLGRLVDRSLVVAEPAGPVTCYRLLEVLRERAVEGLVRSGRDATVAERFVDVTAARADGIVREGLVQWSGELVHRAGGGFHDVVSALHWCIERDDGPQRAFRLLLPLFVSIYQSRPREVLAVGRQVLSRWPREQAPWRGEAVAVLANAAVMAGEHEAAVELGEQALATPATVGAAPMAAHLALGLAARSAGDLGAALEHFTAGRKDAATLGAASFERELAGFEASILAMKGDTERALELVEEVIAESAARGDALTEAWARLLRAGMAMGAERWDEAQVDVARARAATERLGSPWWQGPILRSEAIIVAHDATAVGLHGGWTASVDSWRSAIESAAARGSAGELAMTVRTAAAVAARLGHDDVAVGLLDAAPVSTELAMLPELFQDEVHRLTADRIGPPPPPDIATALRRARAVLDQPRDGPAAPPGAQRSAGAAEARTGALRRTGDHWVVEYGGKTATMQPLKGLLDLAALLAQPGEEVHCLQLMGGVRVGGEPGPVIDEQARQAYQRRIRDLQAEIDEAQDDGNAELARRAEEELDALVGQLTEAFGLSGRRRATGSSTERARSAVTYRVRSAIRRLGRVNPELERHLDNAVRTGTWCAYRPETDIRWDIGLDAA